MAEEKISPKDRQRIAIVAASEAGKRMLRRKCKNVSTRILYVKGAILFSEHLGKGFDNIVNEYKADAKKNLYNTFDKWELIYEDYADWLVEKYGEEGTTAKSYFQGAVALINANVPKSARIQPSAPPATPRTIPPIPIEDLRTIRAVADERERAFIDFLKDSGISRDDAVGLTYKVIKKAIEDKTIRYLKIDMYRSKENVEYETWLGPNAIDSLRIYFMVRRQRGEKITDATPIFASDKQPYEGLPKGSLSAIFRRLTKKTGIAISTHRLRKFFETYITAGGVHPITAKYWMGHKIRGGRDVEARYIIPPENLQREQYTKAYNYIDLRERPDREDMLMAEIKTKMELLPPQQRKPFFEKLRGMYRHSRFTERLLNDPYMKRIIEGKVEDEAENENCSNGEHCTHMQIKESELLSYLQQGWQIVHNLQNGEVIVKR